jgi:hypothetical protein
MIIKGRYNAYALLSRVCLGMVVLKQPTEGYLRFGLQGVSSSLGRIEAIF